MEAKLKAKILVENFRITIVDRVVGSNGFYSAAKQCALDCVDEIIHALEEQTNGMHNFYWAEVRSEIENYQP